MKYDSFNFIYLSEILNLPVYESDRDKKIGHITDLASTTSQVFPRITGVLANVKHTRGPVYIPWANVRIGAFQKRITVDRSALGSNGVSKASESEILIGKTFLDKQIISTSGYKLVRVNDLQLLVDSSSKENPNLWLVHIDIGFKGLIRRLGWLTIVNAVVRWLLGRDLKDKFVSWKYVQATATANVYGSMHLQVDSSKLSDFHPADLADVLEELGTDERTTLVESLEAPIAAATLQEMPMNVRVQIAESLGTEKLAGIISEMQMDEIVDLLDELSDEKRVALYTALPHEKISEIRDLARLSEFGIGSIMNTDFIVVKDTQTVKEVMKTVKQESKKAELVYYVYVADEQEHLKGMVTLRSLLTAKSGTLIADIMKENLISVELEWTVKRVAQLFFKYNFEAIPVVNEEGKIQGIITMRDALKSVFPEIKKEAEG
jgi:CBS domain-containing protein/sporulation protein YlmC with PRC-barrel domain